HGRDQNLHPSSSPDGPLGGQPCSSGVMKRRTGRRAGASPNAAGGARAALQETTGEEPLSSRGGRSSPGSWVSRIVKSLKLPWFRKASGLLRFSRARAGLVVRWSGS